MPHVFRFVLHNQFYLGVLGVLGGSIRFLFLSSLSGLSGLSVEVLVFVPQIVLM